MKILAVIALLFFSVQVAANSRAPAFELITLGDSGGIQDGNLTAFLLRASDEDQYIALDAGTIVNGINAAIKHKAFANLAINPDPKLQTNGSILHHHIAGYFVSHGHLDHVAGLLISSPEDNAKPIYGLPSVNQTLLDTYFNWQAWANFTNRGKAPRLNKYQLIDLTTKQTTPIAKTGLKVTPFSLSHPLESTAFVIEKDNNLFVYFGDTGPDSVEKQGKLKKIWQFLAKEMQTKQLRALVIEVSFDNERPDHLLFGHLTPQYLMEELNTFNSLLGDKTQLQAVKIIISHIKYSLKTGPEPRRLLFKQLQEANPLGLQFTLAKQGQRLIF